MEDFDAFCFDLEQLEKSAAPDPLQKNADGHFVLRLDDEPTRELDEFFKRVDLQLDGPILPDVRNRLRSERTDEGPPLAKRAPGKKLRKVEGQNGWLMFYDENNQLVRGFDSKECSEADFEFQRVQ